MKRRLPPAPPPPHPSMRWIPIVLCLLIVSDLVYIHRTLERIEKTAFYQAGQVPISSSPQSSLQTDACPGQCTQLISTLQRTVDESRAAPIEPVSVKASVAPDVKEYFISLGSGSSSSGDWQSVPGLEATVDAGNYPGIKRVIFEAALMIPTGNQTAYVRLFNASDKHPVWGSELSLDGGVGKLLTTGPITLDKGSNLYQVQMKTSLKYEAKLNQARLRILLK